MKLEYKRRPRLRVANGSAVAPDLELVPPSEVPAPRQTSEIIRFESLTFVINGDTAILTPFDHDQRLRLIQRHARMLEKLQSKNPEIKSLTITDADGGGSAIH